MRGLRRAKTLTAAPGKTNGAVLLVFIQVLNWLDMNRLSVIDINDTRNKNYGGANLVSINLVSICLV